MTRTVYTPVSTNDIVEAKAVQVKTGISDGVYTEVMDGVTENDKVIIGVLVDSSANGTAASPQGSPFGGPMRRF